MNAPKSQTARAESLIDAMPEDELRWCVKMLMAAGHVTPDVLNRVHSVVLRAKDIE